MALIWGQCLPSLTPILVPHLNTFPLSQTGGGCTTDFWPVQCGKKDVYCLQRKWYKTLYAVFHALCFPICQARGEEPPEPQEVKLQDGRSLVPEFLSAGETKKMPRRASNQEHPHWNATQSSTDFPCVKPQAFGDCLSHSGRIYLIPCSSGPRMKKIISVYIFQPTLWLSSLQKQTFSAINRTESRRARHPLYLPHICRQWIHTLQAFVQA